ncbi:MAG: SPL family radical SAM protein [Betaproteobacteria bacterium]
MTGKLVRAIFREANKKRKQEIALVRPGLAAPSLAPLVGTDTLRQQGGVRYLELRARSLVGRCSNPEMPFDWTVNPYRGCAMGCRYCYAAYTHDFLGRDGVSEFHSRIYVKTGGGEETARRLALAAARGEPVALGTATDPYQPGESAAGATRRFLELAAGIRGLRLSITTKGALVLRDLGLLQRIAARGELTVAVSLVSPRAELLRRLEPWAPPPEVRLEVLRRLLGSGIAAGLSVAPILPALTDAEGDLDALLARAAAAGVRRLSWQLLFLRSPTREKFMAWLEQEFPARVAAYRRAYGTRSHLTGAYPRRLRATMARLAERHGFAERTFGRRPARPGARQLRLWA